MADTGSLELLALGRAGSNPASGTTFFRAENHPHHPTTRITLKGGDNEGLTIPLKKTGDNRTSQ